MMHLHEEQVLKEETWQTRLLLSAAARQKLDGRTNGERTRIITRLRLHIIPILRQVRCPRWPRCPRCRPCSRDPRKIEKSRLRMQLAKWMWMKTTTTVKMTKSRRRCAIARSQQTRQRCQSRKSRSRIPWESLSSGLITWDSRDEVLDASVTFLPCTSYCSLRRMMLEKRYICVSIDLKAAMEARVLDCSSDLDIREATIL